MCGIFGFSFSEQSKIPNSLWKKILRDLFLFSESRGKEAAGISIFKSGRIDVLKRNIPASELIYKKDFKNLIASTFGKIEYPFALMGHSRLVTNGSQDSHNNNQPVIVDGVVGVHNGIVINIEEIIRKFSGLDRKYEVDSELIFLLVRKYIDGGLPPQTAIAKAFENIYGMSAVAIMFSDFNLLALATNYGTLYSFSPEGSHFHIFASERYILHRVLHKNRLDAIFPVSAIERVRPKTSHLINLQNISVSHFVFGEDSTVADFKPCAQKIINDIKADKDEIRKFYFPEYSKPVVSEEIKKDYERFEKAVSHLRRCSKCILPETMPFIEFDVNGVCNFCQHNIKYEAKGVETLKELLKPFLKSDPDRHDCIVAISGGRDSCFALHYLTTELGLKSLAYTYDWGMVTDLARRNISRLCGKLGVEHILVSADIKRKRENIRKNVSAWLKNPALGTVPLFMAGDKQFFYYVNVLKKQTGINLDIWSGNPLERTDFKVGFCGLQNKKESFTWHKLTFASKAKIAAYYTNQFIRNPAYFNSSLFDTLFAYVSYYIIPQNNILFYNYVKWDEKTIVQTLREKYDWELATDTTTTWRIGDGTAPFYNYIYYTAGGFSEVDTFYSNMIRENMVSREEALKVAHKQNQPRYESIKWYTDTIGIDFESAIKRINQIPKLYSYE